MTDGKKPGQDYEAARSGAAVGLRRDRRFLRVSGRSPGEMLSGLLTNRTPRPPRQEGGWSRGEVLYSALLTHKGRMITDLRILAPDEEDFLLDLPLAGLEGAMSHFRTFLPPRMAQVSEPETEQMLLTVVGPGAPEMISGVWSDWVLDGSADPTSEFSSKAVHSLREGEELVLRLKDGNWLRILANGDLSPGGWDLLLPSSRGRELDEALLARGTVRLSDETRDVLRVEKGRPEFGKDMDSSTIPVEAGIHRRAVDDGKGCYTGQEVMIRIRDRGHVNRSLRGLIFSESSVPDPGEELFIPGREKPGGHVTSAVWSPAMARAVGLGYVRRGVSGGETVRVGSLNGPEVEVRELGDQGWIAPTICSP